ncbi:hypothetical protein [Nitrososphaera sp.]|uniref:hypothetical protein n=1 Tax=Nitrososphaera sp. TaxID=1971748 RepID=UPI002ED9B901
MVGKQFLIMSLVALVLVVGIPLSAYAQEGDNSMTKTTSKGSLDIRLEPIQISSHQVQFKVSFLDPGTNNIHQHQDYDFKILKNEQEIFSAAKQYNQPLLHNVEGTITVPYTFEQNGGYAVELQILGTGYGPTVIPTDENAVFSIQVTPEFPAGALFAIAAVTAGTIATARIKKL